MVNIDALEKTLSTLRNLGRLEAVDAALVQALRSMAESLDRDPSNAALWRQYREALRELRADESDSSVDADIEALYSEVRDSSPS